MSASLSFPNTKWRKRRRESSNLGGNNKRQKPEDDEDDEDDVEDDPEIEEDDDLHPMEVTPPPLNHHHHHHHIESEVLSSGGTLICDFPKVIGHTVNRPHSSVMEIVSAERACLFGDNRLQNSIFMENISHGQLQALCFVPSDSISLQPLDVPVSNNSSYVCTPPAIMEGGGVVKRYGYGYGNGSNQTLVVPMHADWFTPNSVNRLERQVVPHFFAGKSSEHTPDKYMDCRNSIVAKYMENPEKRLLVTDCQGLVPGVDLHDLNRIVRFLDHWGIINYSAPAPNREPRLGAPYLKEDSTGDLHIHSAALKSIYSLIHFDKPKSRIRPEDLSFSLVSSIDDISDLDDRIRERLSEYHCNYCSRPLPRAHFQSQKEADVMLCVDCFHEGRYIVGHSSIDFIRANSSKDFCDFDGDSWTDQETLLLLEALEIYNDNWNDIAEHVGTKSKAQCILHFISLPMEDGILENIEIPSTSVASDAPSKEDHRRTLSSSNGDSARQCPQDLDSESRLPFGNCGNPVMALVSFVSSTLGPRVASACAHASLAALSKEEQPVEGSVCGDRTNTGSWLSRDGDPQGLAANLNHPKESTVAHGSSSENHAQSAPLSSETVKNAAKLGLAAAAMKAKQFADHEEREIQRMTASIINHQLRKLETKLKQFAEVETLLMKECEQVEKVRQRLAAERARIKSTGFVPSRPNTVTIPGGNNVMNTRPVMSISPAQAQAQAHAQANIPGYGNNNQQTHPQMSFMPRQPMFAFGPRLPLSAIHPSSSNPSAASAMYNTVPSNISNNMGHPMLRPVSGTNTNVG